MVYENRGYVEDECVDRPNTKSNGHRAPVSSLEFTQNRNRIEVRIEHIVDKNKVLTQPYWSINS